MSNTHPDSFHHEADVADALKVCALIYGVDGLHMTGNLQNPTKQPDKMHRMKHNMHGIGIRHLSHLCDHRLPAAIIFVEEVICLDEELTGVFLHLCCTTFPQDHRPVCSLLVSVVLRLLLQHI